MPKRLLEQLAAEGLGGSGGLSDDFEEDDSELVFDDVGPEVSSDVCAGMPSLDV